MPGIIICVQEPSGKIGYEIQGSFSKTEFLGLLEAIKAMFIVNQFKPESKIEIAQPNLRLDG